MPSIIKLNKFSIPSPLFLLSPIRITSHHKIFLEIIYVTVYAIILNHQTIRTDITDLKIVDFLNHIIHKIVDIVVKNVIKIQIQKYYIIIFLYI